MTRRCRLWLMAFIPAISLLFSIQRVSAEDCHLASVGFQGWNAQQLSNKWVRLTFVPQLGGRLLQVEFDGHPYLFVNPKFAGKYISPKEAAGRWINYGGDKIWPLPEGSGDEQHWVLESGSLDDAPYAFKVVSQGNRCAVEFDGPIDEETGLQYSRQISIDSDSPAIHFHAVMRNATAHKLQWSVQSVTQYNLANAKNPADFNRNFWAYTATRKDSAYENGFYVRSGLADDPSFHVSDGLFRLHWKYLSNEVWIDSDGGWLAVADGESGYGMIERFHFDPLATYPGKATVIFYKNGPSLGFDETGKPRLSSSNPLEASYYMEAEVNSPLVTLDPGATYAFDTVWFPLRTGADVQRVTEAGITTKRLHATGDSRNIRLRGSFSAVVSGHLQARIFDKQGRDVKHLILHEIGPRQEMVLNEEIPVDFMPSRISLHLLDDKGDDWGVLDEAEVRGNE